MAGPISGQSTQSGVAGVTGESSQFNGVLGTTTANGHAGVAGVSDQGVGNGVYGRSQNASGVYGVSQNRIGVVGLSLTTDPGQGIGVYGESHSFNAIRGISYAPGHGAVVGVSENHTPQAGPGVFGQSDQTGVVGLSKLWVGVYGESQNPNAGAGVWGKGVGSVPGVLGDSQNGPGIWGRGPIAGRFQGDVEVTGNLKMAKTGDIQLANADCAEDFDIAHTESVDPGTVMVLATEGALRASHQAYDRRVAGIVSGAGDYQPALVLDRQSTGNSRQPIALMGKVFCKVDAQYGPVEIGDLLTTSPTPGHAMKAADPAKAFGAVLGKALRPLDEGQGLIPVLVSLQ